MKRLVKGLGSGRGGARQGFALALTAALQRLPELPTEAVLALMDAVLDTSGSMKVDKGLFACVHH